MPDGWTPGSPAGWYDTADGKAWWDGEQWRSSFTPPDVAAAPVTRPSARPGWKRVPLVWLVLSVLLVVAVAAAMSGGWSDDDPSTDDPVGFKACASFVELAEDVNAGIVTDAEFRDRLVSINDDAKYAQTAAVREASQAMLRTATSGGGSGSVGDMAAACSDLTG